MSSRSSSSRSRSPARQQFGQYGTYEFMANIRELAEPALIAKYGANWARVLGKKSDVAIKQKYGGDGHRLIGHIGGVSTSCKYWNKHCNQIEPAYDLLQRAAGPQAFIKRSSSPRGSAPRHVAYSAKRQADNWSWDNDATWDDDMWGASQKNATSGSGASSSAKAPSSRPSSPAPRAARASSPRRA
jgi:hypothetical protein